MPTADAYAALIEVVATITGVPVSAGEGHRTMNDLAIDSLALADIVGRLERALKRVIDPSILASGRSLAAIGRELQKTIGTPPAPSAAEPAPRPHEPAVEAGGGSDLARLLAMVRDGTLEPSDAARTIDDPKPPQLNGRSDAVL
jgi:acyl carrier protein